MSLQITNLQGRQRELYCQDCRCCTSLGQESWLFPYQNLSPM